MSKAEVFRLGESGLDVSPLEQQREFSYQIRIYDRSDDKVGEFASGIKNIKLINFNFGYLRDGGCADFSFILGDVSPFTIDYHYRVEFCFYNQANPWYSGYVTKLPERGTNKQQIYSGYGYRKQLDGIRINEIDTAEEVADIISDTIDYIEANTDILKDDDKIATSIYQMISTIYWDRIPASDLFERLRQLAGAYEWGVDEEKDFYFRATSTQIFENFWIGKHLDSFEGTEDPDSIKNRLYVKCGRLTDGSDYILRVPDPATEPTASQIAYGLKEDVIIAPEFWPTLDTTNLVTAIAGATNPVAGVPGRAIDGNPATYWDTGMAQAIGHYITVDLGAIYNEIARVVLDSTTTLAKDEFARGFDIQISTTGVFGGEQVIVFTSTALSTNNPDIRFSPTRGRYVRITLTIGDAEQWHLGEFEVYQMDTSDIERWANYILDQKKAIRKKANLTIKKVNELIERKHVIVPYKPRGQWGIYDEDGNHIEDYPVILVKYSLSGDSFDMTAELGELKRESISAEFKRQLQRMEEFNMSGVRRSDDLASGVGTSPLGITGTMIGKEEIETPHLKANTIIANLIEAGAVTAEKMSILKHLVSGATWGDNDPGAGSVSWSGASVTYNGVTYVIADGNTALAYIWWDFSLNTAVFQTAAVKPALADEDFIVCFNNGGTHELIWNATLIEGGTIRTSSITATEINVADLVNIANLLTVAAGRIVIGANALGAGLDGILINDGVNDRVEIGEIAPATYGINIRDAAGNLIVSQGSIIWANAKARAHTTAPFKIPTSWCSIVAYRARSLKMLLETETYDPGGNFDNSMLYSGNTTHTVANKLRDDGATFGADALNMVVRNTTDGTYTAVWAVDSPTVLSLGDDFFTIGEAYEIRESKFVAPVAGNYLCLGVITFIIATANTADEIFSVRLKKNGSVYSDLAICSNAKLIAGGEKMMVAHADIIPLAVNDEVELYGSATTAADVSIWGIGIEGGTPTSLCCHLISV